MKSLQTIQKTFHVFQTLSKIAMILSFVWAGLSALGLPLTMTKTGGLSEMIGVLSVDFIQAMTDGILLVFALGIVLILASLIFRYGAELEERNRSTHGVQ